MEYGIKEMAALSGVSGRTLRYYDGIGLLKPSRLTEAGYRLYGEGEVELLQQILFYRERGFALEEIRRILYEEDFDVTAALEEHLRALEQRQALLEEMIRNVKRTLEVQKGERQMQEKERFEGFKKRIAAENEAAYGAELRESYGEETVQAAQERLLQMTEAEYKKFRMLQTQILTELEQAVLAKKAPEGEEGRRIVELHREWISMSWQDYRENAHRGLAMLYQMDERFRQYYDRNVEGCAAFLQAAVLHWVVEKS